MNEPVSVYVAMEDKDILGVFSDFKRAMEALEDYGNNRADWEDYRWADDSDHICGWLECLPTGHSNWKSTSLSYARHMLNEDIADAQRTGAGCGLTLFSRI